MITVGLPAVKPEYLREAIQSVVSQRFQDFELVICQDRGDERIRKIAGEFSDRRIRYFEEATPRSVVDNWNHVLSHATGEFFVLFADDDRYDPGFLEGMNELIQRYQDSHVFHCRVRKIGPGGEPTGLTPACPEFESGLDFIRERLLGHREQFAPEFLVRTDALRRMGGFVDLPLAWGSDDLTWFTLALEGGIACCAEPLVEWRQSPLQITRSGNIMQRLEAVDSYEGRVLAMVERYAGSHPADMKACQQILSMTGPNAERQKAYLVAIYASNHGIHQQVSFFLKNRQIFRLKWKWLAYSIWIYLRREKV